MSKKVCTKCGVNKPLDEFYWREKRNNYSPSCKICWNEASKAYNKKNREARLKYNKEYVEKNREKVTTYHREYKRKASAQDRVIFNLRNRVYKLMLKEYQSQQTLNLIGCTRQEFMNHLESQFDDKMNWDNYGTYWEVDHIIPLSKGGTIHYLNSQPLEASKNRKKSNKI